jgi:hypothetical protein
MFTFELRNLGRSYRGTDGRAKLRSIHLKGWLLAHRVISLRCGVWSLSGHMVLSLPGWANKTSADLTPASRRKDHTTSPSALAPFVCAPGDRSRKSRPAIASLLAGAAASTASRPSVRDDGQRPGGEYGNDLGLARSETFLRMGLDRGSKKLRDGQISLVGLKSSSLCAVGRGKQCAGRKAFTLSTPLAYRVSPSPTQ